MDGRIQTFLDALRDVDPDSAENLVLREVAYVRSTRKTPASVRQKMTEYRGAVDASKLPHFIKSLVDSDMKISVSEQAELSGNYQIEKRTKTRNNEKDAILSVQGWIDKGENLLVAPSYVDRVLGLCMLTGRRFSEILCTAEFTKVGPAEVVFKGQLKKRLVPGEDGSSYRIPILTRADLAIDALSKLRVEKPQFVGNPRLANRAGSSDAATKVKKHVVGLVSDPKRFTVHDCRRVYAEIEYSFIRAGDPSAINTDVYAQILGHDYQDMGTATAYIRFYIKEDSE